MVIISFVLALLIGGSIFSGQLMAGSFSGDSSQTIGLEPNSTNPVTSTGGAEITVTGNAILPEGGVAGTISDIGDTAESNQISLYVVREGDSLSQIAEMFNVSVNTIAWANDFDRGDAITPGQMLLILPITGVRHTVTAEETIQSIAKKYKGDVKEIIQYNGLDESGKIAKGDIVIIPGGEEVRVVASSGSTELKTAPVRGISGPSYNAYYLRPINGGVKTQGIHGYNGVDLAASGGTPIMAAAAGRIIVSRSGGWNGGYGNYVVIEHDNGTQTLYAHNSSNAVAIGQAVVQGQVIGYVGSTGRSTGNHVHFEIRGAKNPF